MENMNQIVLDETNRVTTTYQSDMLQPGAIEVRNILLWFEIIQRVNRIRLSNIVKKTDPKTGKKYITSASWEEIDPPTFA